jgi:nucleotide-binding universal stress UspA family protein
MQGEGLTAPRARREAAANRECAHFAQRRSDLAFGGRAAGRAIVARRAKGGGTTRAEPGEGDAMACAAEEECMLSLEHRYVAVVGIDFSDLSNHALDHALEVASLNAGEVHVLYVQEENALDAVIPLPTNLSASVDNTLEQVRQRAGERVAAVAAKRTRLAVSRVVAHLRHGSPASEIAQLAADLDADLVVVGSHGRRGVERLLLGSVAERVSRLARCPVWIVRPKNHVGGERVPEIEPPCPDCVARRKATHSAQFWCARHSEHHIRPHRYSYVTNGVYSSDTEPYEATPERSA